MWRLIALVVLAGCAKDTCLTGACPAPCSDVRFQCDPRDGGPLYAGRLADAPGPYVLVRGQGGADDILLSNGFITAVISNLDAPSDLAPTGGNVIDLGPAGGADDVNIIYQLSGILPDDAFSYRAIEVDTTAEAARVTVRGTLDGRADVQIVTHYELRQCDVGLRVRSELFNGSAETQAFTVADAYHWGKRRVAPFSPRAGQGYEAPELELLELSSLWKEQAYGAGAAASDDSPGYGVVACDRERVAGVNDLQITALGTPMTLVEPGDTVIFERLIVTAGKGRGPARAIDAAVAARAQLFDAETQQVSGRVTAGGTAFGGDVRRASVLVYVDDVPASAVVPGVDGRFAATVARGQGDLRLEVWSFGRKVAEAPGPAAGELAVPQPATLQAAITIDGAPAWGTIILHPSDDATRADVIGTFHGRFDSCAPWLGPPHGRSPACNRALVDPQGTELEVPAGRYQVFATAGPERTLAMQEVTLVAGEIAALAFELESVPLALAGWISADLHVHGRASFDSAIPDADRVRSFVAAGVGVIAATDHDAIGDYARVVRELGFEAQVAVMGGVEATQVIPWLDVPGHAVPRVIGHFNFWPLAPGTALPRDEGIEPGTLFDRMAPLLGPDGMMMLNHPWDEPLFGRDQGYLRAIDFDPREPVGEVLLRRPTGGHRNIDWTAIEILNGVGPRQFQSARVLWYALLAQGFIVPGTGNSDSHGLGDNQLGWARNWVDAELGVPTFDAERFGEALRAGKSTAGNGIFISVRVGPAPPRPRAFVGLTPFAPAAGDVIEIEVRAAPWVPVEEVRIVTSRGTRQLAFGPTILRPGNPFVNGGTIRYHAFVPIAQLVDRDDFIVVEAGMELLPVADLDDDGVPDTSDNNGDGRIDRSDVEEDEDTGPLVAPPDPTDMLDPRWAITRVISGAYPQAFTNPVLIDLDGDGWQPPGLP